MNATTGADGDGRDRGKLDDPAWAARLAERLPSGDMHRLGRAAVGGSHAVQTLRAQAASSALRDACDQLLARLESARGDWHRQRFAHAARLTAATAALLILGWAGWYWVREHWVMPIDTQRVANSISNDAADKKTQ